MRRIQLIGNIVKDSEVKNINGQDVLLFTLAVNNKYVKDGIKMDVPHYFDISIWRDNVNKLSNYFKKSTKLYLEGEPSVNLYTDKEGKAKGGIRVRVSYFEFLSSTKKEGETTNSSQPEGNDDMPF